MITVSHYYGIHQGGTKDYHLYLFSSQKTNRYILVKRWGKTASDGQCKIEAGFGNGMRKLDTALQERAKSGYDMLVTENDRREFQTAAIAVQVMPSVHQRALTNEHLHALDPAHPTGGATTQFDPNQSARDDLRASMEKAQREAREAAERKEQDDINAVLVNNPNYGMF